MTQLLVDGVVTRFEPAPATGQPPIDGDSPLRDLLGWVRSRFNSDSELVSTIRVDGIELSDENEAEWVALPVSRIGQLEVFTSPRREFAAATLENLALFATELEGLSHRAALSAMHGSFGEDYLKLVDGIGLFTEAAGMVKRVLKIGLHPTLGVLEADLLSLSRDLLEAQEARSWEFMAELLDAHLPENLAEWRDAGIPAMLDHRLAGAP